VQRKGGPIVGKNDPSSRSRPGLLTDAPQILIVGQHERLRSIVSVLGASDRRVTTVDGVVSANAEMAETTAAVVMVPPVCDQPLGEAIHELASTPRGRGPIPIYVVCTGPVSDSDARSHYLAGAAGVFEWPRESLLLTRLVRNRLEQLSDQRAAGNSLAGAVRTRLGDVSTRRPPRGLRVRVRGGLARLSGRVDSLWARLKLAERAKETPGIERVAAQEVAIQPSGRSDGEIAAALRTLLGGSVGVEHHTLTVMVHDGYVTVLGWVASPEEREHLSKLIGLTEGVRGVNDRTEIDAAAKHRDASRARALESEIGQRFPDFDLHVTVMGDAAVLDGRVARPSAKLAIQRMVYAHSFVRVLNRIAVSPARSAGGQ
jgi:osmotically-inducible protein OsmY